MRARRDERERLVAGAGGEKYGCHMNVSGSNVGGSSGAVLSSCSATMPASQSKNATSRRSVLPRSTRELVRAATRRRDEPVAFDLAGAAHEERREPARLADRRDPVAIAVVLEPVRRVADQEAVRAEEHLVGEVDARRQRLDGAAGSRQRYCPRHSQQRRSAASAHRRDPRMPAARRRRAAFRRPRELRLPAPR